VIVSHPAAAVAVVSPDLLPVGRAGDVAQERPGGAGRSHRQVLHVFHGRDPSLRDLHLDLKGDAGVRVAPVGRLEVAARRRRGDERPSDLLDRHPELARPLAVDPDVHRGVVERLPELQIAQSRDLLHLGQRLLGPRPDRLGDAGP
jgi:hypothetical protein